MKLPILGGMEPNVELKEFLRSRRARILPEDVGMPAVGGSRRVPGLRREELAQLAGVSVDYYIRLEQGRTANPSEAVLDAVARVLHLDDTERAHLFDLAKPAPRARRRAARRPQRVSTSSYQLLENLDLAACPAFILGRRMDVLAINRMGRALINDFNALPAGQRNKARFMFLDENARSLYPDWDKVAPEYAAILRLDAGRHPDDPELSALVGELSVKSDQFRRWWADHQVLIRTSGQKRYHHPVVGDLTIDYQALTLPDDPDQTLFIYTTKPGTPSYEALQLLAHWTQETTTPAPEPSTRHSNT
jgi:transcriptional regulator with XRE-family HTH domain